MCCANSGRQALDVLEAIRPDAILLDVRMPEMDGLDTLAAIRQRFSTEMAVIFFTIEETISVDESLNPVGVISKPFDPLTLHHRVMELLDRWQLQRCA